MICVCSKGVTRCAKSDNGSWASGVFLLGEGGVFFVCQLVTWGLLACPVETWEIPFPSSPFQWRNISTLLIGLGKTVFLSWPFSVSKESRALAWTAMPPYVNSQLGLLNTAGDAGHLCALTISSQFSLKITCSFSVYAHVEHVCLSAAQSSPRCSGWNEKSITETWIGRSLSIMRSAPAIIMCVITWQSGVIKACKHGVQIDCCRHFLGAKRTKWSMSVQMCSCRWWKELSQCITGVIAEVTPMPFALVEW